MKKYSKEEVIKLCKQCCEIMHEATLNGDYKANNKAGEKLIKVFKYFENNREFAMDCIEELIKNDDNVVLKSKMAAFCLALGENINEAEKILYEISNKKENGIFAFNAKMTLKVWKEEGFLKLYQEN